MIQNPLVSVANRTMEIMHEFMTEFGLTPPSRTRVAANPTGKEDSELAEFGKAWMPKVIHPYATAANHYARDVVRGRIAACSCARQACGRLLDDLERSKS